MFSVDAVEITWPQVALAAITSLVTIVATIASVMTAYLNLRNRILDNTRTTEQTKMLAGQANEQAREARNYSVVVARTVKQIADKGATDADRLDSIQSQLDSQSQQLNAALQHDSKKDLTQRGGQ